MFVSRDTKPYFQNQPRQSETMKSETEFTTLKIIGVIAVIIFPIALYIFFVFRESLLQLKKALFDPEELPASKTPEEALEEEIEEEIAKENDGEEPLGPLQSILQGKKFK